MSRAARPWMKWYPADWRADPALRMCSYAARGLWIDLLCLMHEATIYGHLLIAGLKPTVAQIAAVLGGRPSEVERLLGELEAGGVFSRTEAGVIFSRRMVRDKQKAERDALNGKGGGNPALIKTDNQGVNPPDNGRSNPPVNGVDKAQKLEARSQNLFKNKDSRSRSRAARASSPGYADPAVRKQRWEQKISTELIRIHGPERAMSVIESYQRGEPEGKRIFNELDRTMKAGKVA